MKVDHMQRNIRLRSGKNFAPDQREAMEKAVKECHTDIAERAKDPTGVPKLRSIVLTDAEAELAYRIVNGLDDYFICRHLACAFVCPASEWIRDGAKGQGGHFCCPKCKLRHYPWRNSGGSPLVSSVLNVGSDGLLTAAPRDVVGSAEGPGGAQAAAKSGPTTMHKLGTVGACTGEYMVFSTVWSDTATTSLANDFNDITLDLMMELEAMPPRASASTR